MSTSNTINQIVNEALEEQGVDAYDYRSYIQNVVEALAEHFDRSVSVLREQAHSLGASDEQVDFALQKAGLAHPEPPASPVDKVVAFARDNGFTVERGQIEAALAGTGLTLTEA